jgi:outer membrane protein assembly factor BamE (lipoprotein component of BamABCDE complex)
MTIGSRMKNWFLLLPLWVWLTGCATPARRLDTDVLQHVREGESSRAEVEKLLGRPLSLVTGPTGRTLAVYEFANFGNQGFTGPRQLNSRRFSLLYDPNFVVEKKLLSASATRYRVGWKDRLGQPLDRAEIVRTMRPQVTRNELIEKFGPPTVESLTVDGGTAAGWIALEQASVVWGGLHEQILEVVFDESGVVKDYKIIGTLDRPSSH